MPNLPVLCPKNWNQSVFPQEDLEEIKKYYFGRFILPRMTILEINAIFSKGAATCGWMVKFKHNLEVDEGLYDRIFSILGEHKPMNFRISDLFALNKEDFCVIYKVMCLCQCNL
ncbi:hypothetical protein Zmor_019575 [Zophobas morio]|uniref:Uncharacterized protein n=1 Tax=Zophobas morio TaxID=2755281 RepID=A0AA38HZX4_9CUCU|nr:hypothetical protein Zmor_019575 [Zophobas morio]